MILQGRSPVEKSVFICSTWDVSHGHVLTRAVSFHRSGWMEASPTAFPSSLSAGRWPSHPSVDDWTSPRRTKGSWTCTLMSPNRTWWWVMCPVIFEVTCLRTSTRFQNVGSSLIMLCTNCMFSVIWFFTSFQYTLCIRMWVGRPVTIYCPFVKSSSLFTSSGQ